MWTPKLETISSTNPLPHHMQNRKDSDTPSFVYMMYRPLLIDLYLIDFLSCLSRPVLPNLCAAAHKCAARALEVCRGRMSEIKSYQ